MAVFDSTEPAILKQQLVGLSTLLQLEKQCRRLSSLEFGFFVVNDTLRLLNYHQAVLWQKKGRSAKLVAVSGVERANSDSPYLQWLQKVSRYLLRQKDADSARLIAKAQLPVSLQKGWDEWLGDSALWCPLLADDKVLGGMWLTRDEQWVDAEIALIEQLADSYGHAWQLLLLRPAWRKQKHGSALGRMLQAVIISAVLASLALPIKLSVLAPAQLVPVNPLVISSPLRGVVKDFHVQPNQTVKAGDLLFELDDTELRNRFHVAQKAMAVAQAEYQRASRKSLSERDSAIDANLLKAQVAMKKAEANFAAEELARVKIKATRDGIVIFGDVNDWLGKPVVTGEKVLLLADPQQMELEMKVPLDNAVNLEPGGQVRMFLHVDPALEVRGVIRQASYEAHPTAQGNLAYLVKASLDQPSSSQLRIGLMGTAKIYGEETRLYYYLFRRPWAVVRQALGV
jgi:multidrug resistance efflux pump